jgi:hypothetical protein
MLALSSAAACSLAICLMLLLLPTATADACACEDAMPALRALYDATNGDYWTPSWNLDDTGTPPLGVQPYRTDVHGCNGPRK